MSPLSLHIKFSKLVHIIELNFRQWGSLRASKLKLAFKGPFIILDTNITFLNEVKYDIILPSFRKINQWKLGISYMPFMIKISTKFWFPYRRPVMLQKVLASDNENSDSSEISSSSDEDSISSYDEQESEEERIEYEFFVLIFCSFCQTDHVWSLPFLQYSINCA